MSNDEIRVISKDNLAKWTETTTNSAAALLLNDLGKIGDDLLSDIKGSAPSGPSMKEVKKRTWGEIEYTDKRGRTKTWKGWTVEKTLINSGTRTAKEWPVDTGKSRDGWRWYMRHQGDTIELVITNSVRYAFMLKASHTYKSQRAYTYLIRNPLKKQANKFAEVFSEILAREVS